MAKDYGFVTSRIAVGGELASKKDVKKLVDDGITAVLNLRTNQDEVPLVQKAGLKYSGNPTKDADTQTKPPEWFQGSVDFISSQMNDPQCKVYVHCQEGINRGPSTVYFYLRTLGLKKELCRQLITAARPEAANPAYVNDAEAALKKLGYKD